MILALRFSDSRSVLMRRLHERDEREVQRMQENHADTCNESMCALKLLEDVIARCLRAEVENLPEITRESF